MGFTRVIHSKNNQGVMSSEKKVGICEGCHEAICPTYTVEYQDKCWHLNCFRKSQLHLTHWCCCMCDLTYSWRHLSDNGYKTQFICIHCVKRYQQ